MTKEEAREQALGALYASDVLGRDFIDTVRISKRAGELAEGVWARREAIDVAIDAASKDWRIERMSAVDRNILRLATYELLYTDLPKGIAMDQAVELAKRYSTAKSGAFVNGVLGAIADTGIRMPEARPED